MAAIFENFFKRGCSVFLKYPGSWKFRQIEAISCNFRTLSKNSKIQNGRHFWKSFSKVSVVDSLDTLGVENFDEIVLSLTVKEIAYILRFCILAKIQKFKMVAIFENLWKVGSPYFSDTLGVKIFDEIALSLTVKEIAYILRFCIFGENSKMAAIFENFLKSGLSIFLRHPGGLKFQRNCSISHS